MTEKFSGSITDTHRIKRWFKDGVMHRDDGPTIIYPDGKQVWYKYNRRHRDDGPAVIYPNGDQFWYKEGEIHRDYGPAVIYVNGGQYWYKYNKQYEPSAHELMVWKMNEKLTCH